VVVNKLPIFNTNNNNNNNNNTTPDLQEYRRTHSAIIKMDKQQEAVVVTVNQVIYIINVVKDVFDTNKSVYLINRVLYDKFDIDYQHQNQIFSNVFIFVVKPTKLSKKLSKNQQHHHHVYKNVLLLNLKDHLK